tara:strand:+ start:126 stop:770 length:645 start_codon:yes stop_codon:yes gene_type:complete
MLNLNQFLNFDSQTEHVLEHDLLNKKEFSPPKIYNSNGDLSKRWYVYFSFRNPETGKLQRMKNVYGKTNNYKTKEERLSVLAVYRKKLLELLKQGYDPFGDNSVLYNNLNGHEVPKLQSAKVEVIEQKNGEPSMSIKEAFDFGLNLKEKLPQLQLQLLDKEQDVLESYKKTEKSLVNTCPSCKKGPVITLLTFDGRGPPKGYKQIIKRKLQKYS